MNDQQYSYTFKTLSGLESLLEKEIIDAGAEEITPVKRGFCFKGNEELMYRLNYTSRYGIRLLVEVLRFEFTNKEDFLKQVKAFEWDTYIATDKTMAVDAVVTTSELFKNSHFAEQLTKDGIVDFFRNRYGLRPAVDKEFPDMLVNVYVNGNICVMSVDSSGESLHKRGYRIAAHVAPLNEVLAAGIIGLSGWKMDCDFIDPMCGSGTILIEAAMLANNIPAGFYRKRFGFMGWQTYKPAMFERVKKEASEKGIEFEHRIIGMDRSDDSLRSAQRNIINAKLNRDIELKSGNFFEIELDNPGFLLFNPPYDARMPIENSREYYEKIGDTIKNRLKGSTTWLIVGNVDLWKSIGLKTSKKIPLLNGMIESRLLCFESYSGSKRYSENSSFGNNGEK